VIVKVKVIETGHVFEFDEAINASFWTPDFTLIDYLIIDDRRKIKKVEKKPWDYECTIDAFKELRRCVKAVKATKKVFNETLSKLPDSSEFEAYMGYAVAHPRHFWHWQLNYLIAINEYLLHHFSETDSPRTARSLKARERDDGEAEKVIT